MAQAWLVLGSLKQKDHELEGRLNNLERLCRKQANKQMNGWMSEWLRLTDWRLDQQL